VSLYGICNVCASSCPAELGVSSADEIVLKEMHEGAESKEFWEGVGGRKRRAYDSLLIGIYFCLMALLCCYLCSKAAVYLHINSVNHTGK